MIVASLDEVEAAWRIAEELEFELVDPGKLEEARSLRILRLRHIATAVPVDFHVALLPFDYEVVERGMSRTYK